MPAKNVQDGSLQSTKQVLDELDALMEKMLALPVNDRDDAPPFPQDMVKPTPSLSAKLTLLQTPAPMSQAPTVAPPASVPGDAETHPAFNPPHFALQAPAPSASPLPVPLTNDVLPPSSPTNLDPILAQIPDEDAGPPWNPVLALNETFDASTSAFGLGWLRSSAGRGFLGFAGMLLLAAAVGWFLKDYLGWRWPT